MPRAHLTVRGRVQGVGFRWYVVREARALGVRGWVRNRSDGAVEAVGEGPKDALHSWIDAVRRGPPAARVTDIEATWSEADALHHGFDVRD